MPRNLLGSCCVMVLLAACPATNLFAQGNVPTTPPSDPWGFAPRTGVPGNSLPARGAPGPGPGAVGQLPRYPNPNYPVTAQLPRYPAPNGPPVSAQYAQLPNLSAQPPITQAAPPAARPSEVFDLAETIARVGDQHVFRGDLIGDANLMLAPNLAKLSPEQREKLQEQIATEREKLVKQLLQEAIQRKLMYTMFLRSIPAEKLAEAQANIAERVPEQFAEQLQAMRDKVDAAETSEYRSLARQSSQLFRLALLMKQANISSQRELDLFLRSNGSSLEKQHQAYIEDQLGRQAMFQEIGGDTDISLDEMIEYYEKHIEDFRVPTRARWEQVTIRFDRFPTKFATGQEIAKIGNELFFGASFNAIAKQSSHGSNAKDGGYHDWTQWGDFSVSREVNEAVFSLPIGELSGIISDAEGLHIVRVIERQNEHVTSFSDAQVLIKKNIQAERRGKEITAYLANLQDQIPVWTIYDPPDTEQLANPPAGPNRFAR